MASPSEGSTKDNAYLLSLFVHETIHLSQVNIFGLPVGALTVAGELDAWQREMKVYYTLTGGTYPFDQSDVQILLGYGPLDAWTPVRNIDIRNLMEKMSPGYHSYCLLPVWAPEFINALQHGVEQCLP